MIVNAEPDKHALLLWYELAVSVQVDTISASNKMQECVVLLLLFHLSITKVL